MLDLLKPDNLFQAFVDLAMIPLKLILAPVDYFLAQIPGLDAIPQALSAVVGYVGNIPSTFVSLLGINPALWNGIIFVVLAYCAAFPLVSVFKKVMNWARGA